MNDNKIGSVIQELRKRKGYSQGDLADLLHISRQAISRWERDEALPDIYNLKQLSKIFNTSIDDILDNNVSIRETNNISYQLLYVSNLINILIVGLFSAVLSLLFVGQIRITILEILYEANPYSNNVGIVLPSVFFMFFIYYLIEKWVLNNIVKSTNIDKIRIVTLFLGIIKFVSIGFIVVSLFHSNLLLAILFSTVLFTETLLSVIASIKMKNHTEIEEIKFKPVIVVGKVTDVLSKVLISLIFIYIGIILIFPMRYIEEEYDETRINEFKENFNAHIIVNIEGEDFEVEVSDNFKKLKVTHIINESSPYNHGIDLRYKDYQPISGLGTSTILADDLIEGIINREIYVTLKYYDSRLESYKLYEEPFIYNYKQRKFIFS